MSSEIRHPEISVQLVGGDGNAFAVMGAVKQAMRRGGVDRAELDEFQQECMSGDYNHLLATCMRWVDVS